MCPRISVTSRVQMNDRALVIERSYLGRAGAMGHLEIDKPGGDRHHPLLQVRPHSNTRPQVPYQQGVEPE